MIFVFLFFFRLESSFRSFSRPVLHAAARVVQEMGKSRAAAFSVGLQDIDEGVQLTTYSEDSLDSDINETAHSEGIFLVFYQFFFPLVLFYVLDPILYVIFMRILIHRKSNDFFSRNCK